MAESNVNGWRRTDEELAAKWCSSLEQQYLSPDLPRDPQHHRYRGDENLPEPKLEPISSHQIEVHPDPWAFFDVKNGSSGNLSGSKESNYSMPTGNLSNFDGNADTQSIATTSGSFDANYDGDVLISLGPGAPNVVDVDSYEKAKVEMEMRRAALDESLSDRLTGDSSNSDRGGDRKKPGPSRPSAVVQSDRCTTPQMSNLRPRISHGWGSKRQLSQVYHYTYEDDPEHPKSPVPPFVVVPSSGLASRVTVSAVQNPSQPALTPVLSTAGSHGRHCRKPCFLGLVVILILAAITLVLGILEARNEKLSSAPVTPQAPPNLPPWTQAPGLYSRTSVPTLVSTGPPAPVPVPVFEIPNEGSKVDFPDLGPGVVAREETQSPTPADFVAPTRPPRTRRPTSSPAPSNIADRSPAPHASSSNETGLQDGETTIQPTVAVSNEIDAFQEAPSAIPAASGGELATRLYLRNFIKEVSPTPSAAFFDPGTPQGRALDWLVLDQLGMGFLLPTERLLQRFALATFYFATGGDDWFASGLWLSSAHECDWYHTDLAILCDNEGMLHTLEVERNGLSGSLPAELSLLPLRRIFLRENNIGGQIPNELMNLSSLEFLQLAQNELTGSLSPDLGLLTTIVVLGVEKNNIRGTIPSEIGLLTALDSLGLGGNSLSGTIPTELGNLSSLRYVSLCCNWLIGPIPSEVGELPQLTVLAADPDDLAGIVPPASCVVAVEESLTGPRVDCKEVTCNC